MKLPPRLQPIEKCNGKMKRLLGDDVILQLAKDGMCPHYILVNPLSKEEMVLFSATELESWIEKNYLFYKEGNFTPSFEFIHFNRELNRVSHKEVPVELSQLGDDLFELPFDYINTPPGIYFLCKDNKIMYVGQSTSIVSRIATHIKENTKQFDRIFFIVCPAHKLDEIETELIKRFYPPLNIKSNIHKVA